MLGLNAETKGDVEKAHVSAKGKYLATAFLLRSDRRQYGELIPSLKKDNAKQQKNTPKISLTCTGWWWRSSPRGQHRCMGGATKV